MNEKHFSSRLVMIIAIVIAVTSSIITIYSSSIINKNLTTLSVHPFAVSNALSSVKVSVSEEKVRLNRLTNYNAKKDIELVKDVILKLREENQPNIDYVIKNYLGSKKDAEKLDALLHQLYAKEDEYLANAEGRSLAENNTYLIQNIEPIYEDITNLSNKISKFIENTVKRLSASSDRTLKLSVVFSFALSILLITFAILYQRSMTRRIKDQEAYYRDFLFGILSENIDTVFMIYNLERHHFEFVSTNTLRTIGIENRELESGTKSIFQYMDSKDSKELEQAFKSEILQTRAELECLMLNPKTNKTSNVKVVVYPAKEENKTKRYIVSIIDQTEAKKNQQVLKDALMNAQNANKAKSEFLSRMSHEIRTPMNAIIGMCTIAGVFKDNSERVEDCLRKIMSSSRHLLLLINDILDMSKIESGKLTISNQPFLLEEVINNISSIIYEQAREKKQEFEVTGMVNHEELIGDPLRLNQILINLLSNAVKYTPENGSIVLEMKEVNSRLASRAQLRFTIRDTGIGMHPAFIEKIFQPFEQEGQVSGGTGLGLAITKNLVTLANGTIAVNSELGKGSEFIVELPFEISEDKIKNAITKDFNDLKALIVDDDKDTCEHLSIILERLGVHNEWALSGSEGVEHALCAFEEHKSFDIVFMDWKMPDMDGIEASKRIREFVGPDTLIIIISAVNWSEIETEARKAGVNGFITKPMFQSTVYNTLLQVTKKVSADTSDMDMSLADFSGKRFLLVEDNALNLEIAQELLGMTNATIETALNGQLGLNAFINSSENYFDAILMDVQMPVMDGHAASRAIRASKHPQAQTIPIIAMTANAFSEDVSAALQAGMNAHVAKPIDMDILFKTLNELFEKGKGTV